MRNATLRTERVVEGWVERGAEIVLQCLLDPAERSSVENANRTLFVPSLFCLLDNTDSETVQDYFSGTYFLVEHRSKVGVGTARLLEHPFLPLPRYSVKGNFKIQHRETPSTHHRFSMAVVYRKTAKSPLKGI